MDEKTFYTTVAERAGLSKEEVADLTRAVLYVLLPICIVVTERSSSSR